MQTVRPSELFIKNEEESVMEDVQDRVLFLQFKYGTKHYCMGTGEVREIIDFPLFVPYPVEVGSTLGIFNLRGNLVPIADPERFFLNLLSISKARSAEVFGRMGLRLIVFETGPGVLMALPVSEIQKTEVSIEAANSKAGFVPIDGVPHELFDLSSIYEEKE